MTSKTMHWLLALFVLLTLGGCVKNEDALSSSNQPDDPPAADPADDPPADDPPADDPPADPPPADPPPDDPPPEDPPPTDLEQFEITLFPVLRDAANLCVGCHGNGQLPAFADIDVQVAYDTVVVDMLVDLGSPMDSRLYERAAIDRHNCNDDATCDTIAANLLAGIDAWAGNPTPPAPPPEDPPEDEMPDPVDPDPPMDPPPMTDVGVFETTLYPLLRDSANFCVNCHGVAQIPTFAVDDVTAAYNVIVTQQKVDLATPENSRIYLRPAEDRHNCGGVESCDRVAADFLAAIQLWAQDQIPDDDPMQPVMSAVVNASDATDLDETRVEDALIAMFRFEEGAGNVTVDTSGVDNPITLQLEGTEWLDGGGLRNVSGKAQANLADSQKLFGRISATGEYTVEAWVIPDNVNQDGPARIVSYSQDTAVRNFTMGQNAIYYVFRNRSNGTGQNGTPELEALAREVATSLSHVVMTFDETSGRRIYVDGELLISEDAPDALAWTDDQIFLLGNEVTNNRLWMGVFRMVAIHERALAPAEVQQNFDVGLGDLQTLRFDISGPLNAPAFIDVLFRQIDPGAYLFAEPTYVGNVAGIEVRNVRIAVNDDIPVAAQTFRRLDMTVDQSGQMLSPLGAVIPVALGADMDNFQLHFELLGGNVGQSEEIAPPLPPPLAADVEEPDHGIRSFAQINDTMADLTGVDPSNGTVAALYQELLGQLPSSTDVLSFNQSQQIAIQRLATGYCGEVVNDSASCTALFGACDLDAGDKAAAADFIFDRFIGDNIATQPMRAGVTTEVISVLDDLGCMNGCSGPTAATALQASCAAVLASSAISLN